MNIKTSRGGRWFCFSIDNREVGMMTADGYEPLSAHEQLVLGAAVLKWGES